MHGRAVPQMEKSVALIFRERPVQWGLRGDPYLWDDLENYFLNVCNPCSNEEFLKEFHIAFEQFTGNKLASSEYGIYIPRYNHGGMSGGKVSTEFWSEVAIPLLTERLNTYQKT
jgi:hypothetical protein